MPRKVLQSKTNKVTYKKGSILAFTKPQSSSDLLKSKDGLKQGRIEAFMQRKAPSSISQPQRKKRPLSSDDVIPDTPSPKITKSSTRKSPRRTPKSSVIDLTDDESNGESQPKAKRGLIQKFTPKLKQKSVQITERKSPNRKAHFNKKTIQPVDKNEPLKSTWGEVEIVAEVNQLRQIRQNCKFLSDSTGDHDSDVIDDSDGEANPVPLKQTTDKQKELSQNDGVNPDNQVLDTTQSDSDEITDSAKIDTQESAENDNNILPVDDFCLDDSFLNAALDGISPMKEKKVEDAKPKLLSCSISCSRTSHSMTKFRFNVLNVSEGRDAFGFPTKVLNLENSASKSKLNCVLQDGWVDTKISDGDVVNVIADDDELSSGGDIVINTKKNLLIIQPDILLSGTTISNAIGCKRRAILNERFRNTESGDCGKPVMLIGTIVHTLFQNAIQQRRKMSHEELFKLAKNEVSKLSILRDILALGTTQNEVLNGVKSFIPSILKWTGEYVRDGPTVGVGELNLKFPNGYKNEKLGVDTKLGKTTFSSNVALSEVKDIEENVWSPFYGLKGKIDATGGFLVRRRDSGKKSHFSKVILPLELKTGRESHSTEHHAQVAIYSMFCKQRRNDINGQDGTLPAGLLLYLKTGNMSCIPLKWDDERELSIIRNDVVSHITKSVMEASSNDMTTFKPSALPSTIDNERFCTNCSQLRNCSLFYNAIEKKQASFQPSTMMSQLIDTQTAHLSTKDTDYFNHWVTCTLLETRKSMKDDLRQYYWLRSPEERQEARSCVTNLILAGHGKLSDDGVTSLQTFKKSAFCDDDKSDFSIFTEGELVVISGDEHAFVAMASGTVSSVTENFITIFTERRFEGYSRDMKYSIDKHEWPSVNSFKASFHNLSVIMQASSSANRLRDLIIHHDEPTFKSSIQEVIPKSAKDEIAKMLRGLNRTQRQAIKRVLLSNDYTLVVGMPGSGKTTTIVAMVRILLLCGCRVLLTSYTHSAIDNLLIKVIKYKIKFLRLGRLPQIHPSIHKYSEEVLTKGISTSAELETLYSEAKVVGCTCLAVTSHALFTSPGNEPLKRSRFDVCIVDEASQISQPACLAPLLHADRFVLVGDHRQLPPLVRSRKAKSIGADESLFWRLCHHKPALCDLTLQYRMNSTIMDVSNFVTYEGRLECASESTATAKLKLPNWTEVVEAGLGQPMDVNGREISNSSWLLRSLDPESPVVFLDTSKLKAYEDEVENGICNKTEAEILKIIIDYLIRSGCNCDNIGIIAPFRKQLKVIEDCLSTLSDCTDNVEINTVDKYQGRDKSVILMSFVRSKSEESNGDKAGEILSDWRRLNVALTRAKHKMVLIGCQRTLSGYEPCKKLLQYLNDHSLIVSL